MKPLILLLLALLLPAQAPQWVYAVNSPADLPVRETVLWVHTQAPELRITAGAETRTIALADQPQPAPGWYRVVLTLPVDAKGYTVTEWTAGRTATVP